MTLKGAKYPPWTSERNAAVVAAYKSGKTHAQLIAEFHTQRKNIIAALDEAGIFHGRRDKGSDIAGRRFGKLVVLAREAKQGAAGGDWLCKCNCGVIVRRRRTDLLRGKYKSCGCGQVSLKHGRARTATYQAWADMKVRCTNPEHSLYPRYGGKGISVCKRWAQFESFYLDMGERPRGKVLGRRDVRGNYEPSNCVWTTLEEMANARTGVAKITFRGITQSLVQWARTYGLCPATVRGRIKRGWDVERALTEPPAKQSELAATAASN